MVEQFHQPRELKTDESLPADDDSGFEATQEATNYFLRLLGSHSLLTAAEEVRLARTYTPLRLRVRPLKLELIKAKTPAARQVIAARIADLHRAYPDQLEAKHCLVTSNQRLIFKVARKYIGRGLPMDDLIQEGNLGMDRAIDKYDPERGWRFSTYATWWLRQTIRQAIKTQTRNVDLPVQRVMMINELHKAQDQLTTFFGRVPTRAELAEHLDLDLAEIQNLMQDEQPNASLNIPLPSVDGDAELIDLIPHTGANTEEAAMRLIFREQLYEVISHFPPLQQEAFAAVLGLPDPITGEDRKVETYSQVAKRLGISPRRSSKYTAEVLDYLRNHPRFLELLQAS